MHHLKRNTKFSILAFLIIVLSVTMSISTLGKTEVYFSFYDIPQILSTTSPKPEVQTININTASHAELMKVLKISEILALSDELEGFKEPEDLLQSTEITELEWEEWEEEEIKIIIE